MSSSPDSQKPEFPKGYSRGVQWYKPELESVSPQAREIFEKYSHIPPAHVESHIKYIRERAWEIFPWPCIGYFQFLDLSVSTHPSYSRLLAFLKEPDSHRRLLDLGCCFAQDIRKLIYDGVPHENLYACDHQPKFLDLGFELFADRDTCHAHFFIADVFEEGGPLDDIEGTIDAIYAGAFLHLFSWDDQIIVCKRMIRILKPRKGSVVFGRQSGNVTAHETVGAINQIKRSGKIWSHNAESMERMWDVAGSETGTKWKTTVQLDEEWEKSRMAWHDDGLRKLVFEIERLE